MKIFIIKTTSSSKLSTEIFTQNRVLQTQKDPGVSCPNNSLSEQKAIKMKKDLTHPDWTEPYCNSY